MAGQILGAYFKAVIGSMLNATATLLFPKHRKRLDELKDDAWYPIEEYNQMMADLHAKLGDSTMSALGQASIQKTFHLTKANGFDTLEKAFGNFNALSAGVVRDMPHHELVHTVSFTKDSAVLECGARLPPSLMLGYFRGMLFGFGKLVTSESAERRGNTVRFTLKWV